MRRKSTETYKARFGYVCMICGKPGNIAHHIVPLSKGGIDHSDNWMILCRNCEVKERVHKNADLLEVSLATRKHYFEIGQEIPKSPEIFMSVPHMTINLMKSQPFKKFLNSIQSKPEASTRPSEKKKGPFCPCGCGEMVIGRPGKKYANENCRWKYKNEARLRVMSKYWQG